MPAEENLSPQFDGVHTAFVNFSYDRVLARNQKTGENTKTVGWRTRCACGHLIETKNNSIKAHRAKVDKHLGVTQEKDEAS
jgi:hypothetical protein